MKSAATLAWVTYQEIVAQAAATLERLEPQTRLAALAELISPLLDDMEQCADDLYDEQVMSTPEAVRAFRRISAGGSADVDGVHYHLTYFALLESEDQDRRMHVRSQAAWLAAQWLQWQAGRLLPAVEDFFVAGTLTEMVNTLAWTRARQIEFNPEEGDQFPEVVAEAHAILAVLNQ